MIFRDENCVLSQMFIEFFSILPKNMNLQIIIDKKFPILKLKFDNTEIKIAENDHSQTLLLKLKTFLVSFCKSNFCNDLYISQIDEECNLLHIKSQSNFEFNNFEVIADQDEVLKIEECLNSKNISNFCYELIVPLKNLDYFELKLNNFPKKKKENLLTKELIKILSLNANQTVLEISPNTKIETIRELKDICSSNCKYHFSSLYKFWENSDSSKESSSKKSKENELSDGLKELSQLNIKKIDIHKFSSKIEIVKKFVSSILSLPKIRSTLKELSIEAYNKSECDFIIKKCQKYNKIEKLDIYLQHFMLKEKQWKKVKKTLKSKFMIANLYQKGISCRNCCSFK